MGELIVDMFVTLDGVIQAPGGRKEDQEDGFPFGGWQAQFMDEEAGAAITKAIQRNDALVLGRKTYDIFADYWPTQTGAIADKLNAMPKYVASRTRKDVDWAHSTLVEDVAKDIPRIKAKHKEVHVIGSAHLVQSLMKHDLVDRFNIWQYPVVLGTGKRLFEEGTPPMKFKRLEAKGFPGGGVLLSYERAGRPTFADIG